MGASHREDLNLHLKYCPQPVASTATTVENTCIIVSSALTLLLTVLQTVAGCGQEPTFVLGSNAHEPGDFCFTCELQGFGLGSPSPEHPKR